MKMFYSIIIPVFNRPDELDELLESLTIQTYTDFEVIVVDDGSTISCEHIVDKYRHTLSVHYFYKSNSGPGQTRNYGAAKSAGEYLIFLDSDCIVPQHYLSSINRELTDDYAGFFGGPDRAHHSFTNVQKAINYSMTSFLTTGGIRGNKKSMDHFFPRSFNMGIEKKIFKQVGGFSKMRFGEDIDLSIRVLNSGCKSRLFPDSWVYHKRRTDLKKFFKQVFNSGLARINLHQKHPGSLKAVHVFPALFAIYIFLLPVGSWLVGCYALIPFVLFFLSIFMDALLKTHTISLALLSMVTSFIQLFAYGCGFIYAFFRNIVLKQDTNSAFDETFYA